MVDDLDLTAALETVTGAVLRATCTCGFEPAPGGGACIECPAMAAVRTAAPLIVRAAREGRYTLAEARQLLAEQECAGRGHDLDQIRNGAGDSVAVFCERCGLSFAPVDRRA